MAIFKDKPEFDSFIAEQALRSYFDYYKNDNERSLDQISKFTASMDKEAENLKKINLRTGRILADYRLIGSYLISLSDRERKFLEYRYGKNEKYIWISQKLFVSLSSLCDWNNKFLSDLSQLLSYSLNDKDVFCYLKVINVVRNLDYRINMLLLSQIPVDQNFLCYLDSKRQKYRKLMQEQNEILKTSKDSLHNMIIAEKLLHHNDSIKMICKKLKQSGNIVSWHLRKYENEVKKYLV